MDLSGKKEQETERRKGMKVFDWLPLALTSFIALIALIAFIAPPTQYLILNS